MFTIQQAFDRITAENGDLFLNFSPAQALQRFNRILDAWYESASWRGVKSEIALTSSGGIITLPSAWIRLDKRIVVTTPGQCGRFFEIKPLEYKYQTGGPGYFENAACLGVAIDQGDNASGVRTYQLTGNTTTLDGYAYSAIARKRYVWTEDFDTVVIPDCYSALELSVRAMKAQDDVAADLAQQYWAEAYAALDGNIGQFEEGNDFGTFAIDPGVALNCANLI